MDAKCNGCGAKIQCDNPKMPGYLRKDVYEKRKDDFLCERCFNIMHYNKNIKVSIGEQEFLDIAEKISKEKSIIVNVIDAFDLDGTIIKNINKLFPKSKILLVANKYDLFLRSNKPNKIKRYILEYLKNNNIDVEGVCVCCAKEEECARIIIEFLEEKVKKEKVYFFGTTNVGKSTLINTILNTFMVDSNGEYNPPKITVSNNPGTTLDIIEIKLPNGLIINDTPGLLNKHQVTSYLENKSLTKTMPRKYVKPRVFQLNPKQTLFIGGFAFVNFLEGERSSFVMNVSNDLVVHRCKLENSEEFYNEHFVDILKIPTLKEKELMGNFKNHYFDVDGKCEISISGLGFIGITGKGKVCVKTFENINVIKRDPMV